MERHHEKTTRKEPTSPARAGQGTEEMEEKGGDDIPAGKECRGGRYMRRVMREGMQREVSRAATQLETAYGVKERRDGRI